MIPSVAEMDSAKHKIDAETLSSLQVFDTFENLKAKTVPNVKTVLVVLSSRAMAFDPDAIRQKTTVIYSDAAVFFKSTSGQAFGAPCPKKVDLLIDLTGPREVGNLFLWGKQSLFAPMKLKKLARFSVGRDAGPFRKKLYDRVLSEKELSAHQALPANPFEYERRVQTLVFGLAGIAFIPIGSTTPNLAKEIALELPPLSRS